MGPGYYHSYLLVTDSNGGAPLYGRGGPTKIND